MTHETTPAAPVRRAFQIYLYAVCFVTVLVTLFAIAESAYGLFRIISPETTLSADFGSFDGGDESNQTPFGSISGARSTERRRGTAQFIQMGLIAAAAGLIFRYHQRQATTLRAELEAMASPPPPPPAPEPLPEPEATQSIRRTRAPAKKRRT